MIFWGVLALTLFGWVSSILESVFSVLSVFYQFAENAVNAMQAYGGSYESNENVNALFRYYHNTAIAMRAFEILTIAGWVLYVVGLSKFKEAQLTNRAYRLTGSLNTACWLGISSIACYFFASFLGMFGFLFRLIGWVLMLVSMIKFRGAFDKLSWEKSWNSKAHRGAENLRRSYTLDITLTFYPLICGIVMTAVVIGGIGNMGQTMDSIVNDGMGAVAQYAASFIGIIVILALAGFVMWLMKFIYLLLGWNRISNGNLIAKKDEGTDDDDDDDNDYEERVETEEEEEEEEENEEEEEEEEEDSNSKWIIGGSIAGGAVIIAVILWLTLGGKSTPSDDNTTEIVDSISLATDDSTDMAEEIATDEDFNEDAVEETTEPEEETPNRQTFRGTIDFKHDIVMTLDGSATPYYTGEYYYTAKNVPIKLQGKYDEESRQLVLDEYAEGEKTGTFDGVLSTHAYVGNWTSADGTTSLPFSVRLVN